MYPFIQSYLFWLLLALPIFAVADNSENRGEYLFHLANCYVCHTDVENNGTPLAGGRRLETEFGTFITPNITSDEEAGIGSWTDFQFVNAVKHGIAPSGLNYYPAFPYTSYRNMAVNDILAIKKYLMTTQPSSLKHPDHELKFYLFRQFMPVWNWINNYLQARHPVRINRAAYVVDTLGHCHECHTPRNFLGMLDMQQRFQGNESLKAPDITPSEKGLGDWSKSELEELFTEGILPDGDYVSDHMAEVVEFSTSQWSDEDLQAVITFLRKVD